MPDSPPPPPQAHQHLYKSAHLLRANGIFTGGPLQYFESAGRLQLATLLREGLYPQSKVLDVGCGCLRGGYWLIHFLDSGGYFGIEPAAEMLQQGIQHVLEPETLKEKRPRFDNNSALDFSVFDTKFDVVLARSIWTHTSKTQITTMLESFLAHSSPDAFFLASYHPAGFLGKGDYKGDTWKGKSHESDIPALVQHSFDWIKAKVESRGLFVRQLPDLVFNDQHWLKISRNRDILESAGFKFE